MIQFTHSPFVPTIKPLHTMKMIDSDYPCPMPDQGFGHWTLQCHLCIFQSLSGVQTVVMTNLGIEIIWLNPYLLEKLVAQIIEDFHLDATKAIWIQPFSSGSQEFTGTDFCQVKFQWQNGQATNAQWLAIAPEVVQELISENSEPHSRKTNRRKPMVVSV